MKILQIMHEVGTQGGVAVYGALLDKTLRELGHVTLTTATERDSWSPVPSKMLLSPRMFGFQEQEDGNWNISTFVASLPWTPDVIICHHPPFPKVASELAKLAPVIAFQHSYLCTPGHLFRDKDEVCTRTVGLTCLPRWYGRQCGSHKNPKKAFRMIHQAERDRETLSWAHTIVANSHYLAGQLKRERVVGRFEVLYPGCPTLILGKKKARPQRNQKAMASFVGRIVYSKGLQVLVDAVAPLETSLEIAGDGWYRDQIEKIATPNINLRGYINHAEIGDLHGKAWVSALPSLSPEAFGMAGVEALAAGTPVVAFQVGGIPEWLSPDVGALVDPLKENRVENLRAALAPFLTRPPTDQVADACIHRANELCGPKTFSDGLSKILANAV